MFNLPSVPQFVELRPAYRTCPTFLGAVPHFWDAVPQKVELFHFVSVFLDTAKICRNGNNLIKNYFHIPTLSMHCDTNLELNLIGKLIHRVMSYRQVDNIHW